MYGNFANQYVSLAAGTIADTSNALEHGNGGHPASAEKELSADTGVRCGTSRKQGSGHRCPPRHHTCSGAIISVLY